MLKTPAEVLGDYNIYRCRECNCVTASDWKFVDFTNKQVIECPQCREKYYLEILKEVREEKDANK